MPRIYTPLSLLLAIAITGLAVADDTVKTPKAGDSESAASAGQAESVDPLLRQGEAIYAKSCKSCHGKSGEGVDAEDTDPLVGDLSTGNLAELIAETMPEEDPESCTGEQAAAVAKYIHHTFYSEAAQVRRRPPRIQLARLTGEQLRQSLADLYGHFGSPPWTQPERGVRATYYDGTKWKDDKKRIERVDPVIDFDFGHEAPGKDIDAKNFFIHWSGSLKVDRSGPYEIVLRSSCSCTMDFGSNGRQLINNHVQSEGKEEFRRTLHLTAGHAYPFEIDFFQRKRKTEQPAAKVSLSWIPPGGSEEVIPTRHLIAGSLPASYPLQAKLPPDDRSYGYERGTSINRQWDQSTTDAALEFAQVAIDELYPQYRKKHRNDADEDRAKLRGFLTELAQTAFRGQLDDDTKRLYIDDPLAATEDDGEAIKRVLLLSLKSPRFLYPTLDSDRSPSRRAANRLALVLFDSLPSDEWLIQAAEKDQLSSEEQISQAAWKMVNDYRTQAKTRAFLHAWFDLEKRKEIVKDQDAFPGFDPPLIHELWKSFDAFLDDVVWSEASDFRQLLQADWAYTSDRMEKYYGDAWRAADETEGAPLRRSVGNAEIHSGAISHPLLMSELAYHKTTSPIHRGVFLTRYTLGRVLRPPNAAFTPLNPDLHPKLTTRQRVELQTDEVNCQVCHQKINPLGFALEAFDATGRFRSSEQDQPINAAGSYVDRDGNTITFNGARELGDYLAGSQDCHRAFVESAFEHFVKQPIAAFGSETSDRLTKSFQESGFNIRQLLVTIAVLASQQAPPQPTAS